MKKVVILLLLLAATSANAGIVVNILDYQDAEIYNAFGNTTPEALYAIGNGMAAGNSRRGTYRSLIGFDFANYIPQGAKINSVSLSLYQCQTAGSGGVEGAGDSTPRTIGLFRVLTPWVGNPVDGNIAATGQAMGFDNRYEGATWFYGKYASVPWMKSGGDFATTASAYAADMDNWNQWRTWSSSQMVADVQGWVDGTKPNYGWILINNDEGSTVFKDFRLFYRGINDIDLNTGKTVSTDTHYYDTVSAYAPYLTVDYTPTPLPPAFYMFGSGLIGLFGVRSKYFRT